MTGGLARVYDEDGSLLGENLSRAEFLKPERFAGFDHTTRQSIHELVELHASKTSSRRGQRLANWESESQRFARMTPVLRG